MTRLLNTPIIGPSATKVASSTIDMLAGLSGLYIFRMPPDFWANAGSATTATSNGAAIANAPRYRFISVHLPLIVARPHCPGLDVEFGLLVEPNVFKAPAIKDAVDHHPQSFDSRLPAGGAPQVIDDRPRLILLQSPVDLPHQPLALLLVGLHRLLLEHFLQLGIAIPGVITLRAARIILIELRIGVVDADPSEIEADLIILAVNLGKPVGGLDRVELAVDVDLFELVDQDDRRIAENSNVPL